MILQPCLALYRVLLSRLCDIFKQSYEHTCEIFGGSGTVESVVSIYFGVFIEIQRNLQKGKWNFWNNLGY